MAGRTTINIDNAAMIVRRALLTIVLPRRGVTRLLYEVRDNVRVRKHRNVTGIDLNSRRTHALRHEALLLGVDRPVFLGHDIRARLALPRWSPVHFRVEQRRICRTLRSVDQNPLGLRQVSGKMPDGDPVQPDVTVDDGNVFEDGSGLEF